MNERSFILYDKQNGKILLNIKFVTPEDSVMPTDKEMAERSIELAERYHRVERSKIDRLELTNDLKEGVDYEVDVNTKQLKTKPPKFKPKGPITG